MHKIRVFCRESSSDPLSPSGILKIPRATRRALGPPLRPPFVASLLSPASAPALGPGGLPSGFSKSPPGFGGSERRFPPKNPNFLYIFFYRVKFTISRGFVYGYPLGDLCTVIPPKAGDFTEIPRFS